IGYRWLGAVLGDCAFSISAQHKFKNALMMIATIGPLELAGLLAICFDLSDKKCILRAGEACGKPAARSGRKPHVRNETARVHHASRRRGGRVATRGAGAAAGQAADYRLLGRGRYG